MTGQQVGLLGRTQALTVSVSTILESIGLAALLSIVLVTVVDVIGDKVFGWPVAGSTEIIGLLQVLAISSGLAFSKIDGKQIYVGFLFDALVGWGKTALEILTSILALGFWVVACWRLFEYAFALLERGTSTFILGIPCYPFVFWIAVCCGITMVVLLVLDLINAVARRGKGGDTQ